MCFWPLHLFEKLPFCPLLKSPGAGTLTGVAELWIVSTLEMAVLVLAFGLCRGAIEVSVGPMASVILEWKVFEIFVKACLLGTFIKTFVFLNV